MRCDNSHRCWDSGRILARLQAVCSVTQPNEERKDDESGYTMRLERGEIAQNLQDCLEAANREGRSVMIAANDFYDWPGGLVAEHIEQMIPQWLVVVMIEWCTIDPQPAMSLEEWVAAMASCEVLTGPYALWEMLKTVDAKADALAQVAHDFGFGGKR